MKIKPIYALVALLLATCSLQRNPQVTSLRWLKKQPCEAPCWEHITVGKTTVEQAVAALQSNPLVSGLTHTYTRFKMGSGGSGLVEWRWQDQRYKAPHSYEVSGGINRITFDEGYTGTVKWMSFQYPSGFEFGKVIQAYGEPSHIHILAGTDGSGHRITNMSLIYLSKGFMLEDVLVQSELMMPITTTRQLYYVDMFWPMTRERLAEYPYFFKEGEIASWQGFHSFEFYCYATGHDTTACKTDP